MSLLKPVLFLFSTACILGAQSSVDLNGLAASAARYVSQSVQGQHDPMNLDLRLIRGDNGGHPETLMSKATDVQRWTIFYNVEPKAHVADPTAQEGIVLPPPAHSASVKCTLGLFSDFFLSTPPVPNCHSLENTWLAVSLDGAIAQLNALGYVRGFSKVETRRPNNPGWPDELVYIFECPWERTNVAISCNTGAAVWTQMF